jgi:hypothetical protein
LELKSDDIEPRPCDPETRELMTPLIEADLALYKYGLGLFEKRVKGAHLRGGNGAAVARSPAREA